MKILGLITAYALTIRFLLFLVETVDEVKREDRKKGMR